MTAGACGIGRLAGFFGMEKDPKKNRKSKKAERKDLDKVGRQRNVLYKVTVHDIDMIKVTA